MGGRGLRKEIQIAKEALEGFPGTFFSLSLREGHGGQSIELDA